MRPLNILHITTFYPPYSFGGDATYVMRLCEEQARHGHHVEVAHCVDSYNLLRAGAPPRCVQPRPQITVHSLRSGWGWLSPLLSHQTGLPLLKRSRLKKILAGRRFDVIHFHNISLFGPGILRLDAQNAHTLRVYTAHEFWLVCPVHVMFQERIRPCVAPSCLACQLRSHRPPQIWRSTGLLDRCARHVDLFLAPSRFACRLHEERGFTQPVVALDLFACDPAVALSGLAPVHPRPYFLYVGRLEAIKGIETLLRAWNRFDGADLLIAGAGSQGTALERMAAGHARIRFLAWVEGDLLSRLFREAIAVVVPTVTYEAFGLVIAEAFSHGTPVIVREIGGMPELVRQSGGGLVFATDQELHDALETLVSSPVLRSEFGGKARSAWLRHWTPRIHVDRYFELLAETARKKFGFVPWSA